MSKKIVVLGAGLVGKAMALDLNKKYEVTSVDINPENLKVLEKEGISVIEEDVSKEGTIQSLVKECDLVIGAVPGFMGLKMLTDVIDAGKDIVDISFFPEDPFIVDDLAKRKNVTAVVDCGVAPGMGNVILGYHNKCMEVTNYECLVGGLPVKREWPWEYKAVFSPIDVIEEYTRPARFVVNNEIVTREALSDPELVELPEIGTLESWNSDGLRTLMDTMNIPNMIEKTLRYPGTIEYLRVLRDTGYFSYDEIDLGGTKVRPIDLTSKLLFSKWKLGDGEKEFTVMRIRISGIENGMSVMYEYLLHDEFDPKTKTTSMARTTGYTATAAAELLIKDQFSREGIIPPEYLGEDKTDYDFILNYLKERGVEYKMVKTHL